MELFRNQLEKQTNGIFNQEPQNDMCAKVTTQVFDKTLPSELQFDDATVCQSYSQNFKQAQTFKQQNAQVTSASSHKSQSKDDNLNKQLGLSDYELFTKSILNYTFKRVKGANLIQAQHKIGSFIPHQLKIKTFQAKFFDYQSELSKNVSAFRLLWKSVIGYVKSEFYIKNGFIYILQKRKQGYLVQVLWDMQNLFKLFSDKEEHKLRLIFRAKEGQVIQLHTKQIETEDLNLLAHLFGQTRNLEIVCQK